MSAEDEKPEQITIRDELKDLIAGRSFRPFVVVMASGDRYPVEDAREAILSKDSVTITPIQRGGIYVLRFVQVSSLEIPETL